MSIFIVTAGPTGIGKTFQMQRLIDRDPRRFTSVLSVTTRQRRGPEDGEWYKFVTRESLADLDPRDVISDVVFREERYILLRSEIEKALGRAPIAFMAIVPSVIMIMRAQGIPHALVNCRVQNQAGYLERLKRRGFTGEALQKEQEEGLAFPFPPADAAWPQEDVMLGSDAGDDGRFDAAVAKLAGSLYPHKPS